MYQLLIILFIVCLVLIIRYVRRQAPEKRRELTLRYTLYGLALAAILLVITGRLHWIAAGIAAVLPILLRIAPLLLQVLPRLSARMKQNTSQDKANNPPPASANTMSTEHALKVFGLLSVTTKEEITQRHRELIQKNHPDRGGSDFLAAQINEAKDVLLSSLKTAV